MNKLKRIFSTTLTEEDKKKYLNLHNRLKKKKGCSTCLNCIHARNYPGFVTAEECECIAGLKCDTVMFKVKNCDQWIEKTPII